MLNFSNYFLLLRYCNLEFHLLVISIEAFFSPFDFVHILKTIRNNWLNQQSDSKLFSYPDLNCISIDKCDYPLKRFHASFRDIRMLYNSERGSLAKLTIKVILSINS